ncbi:MAG: sphingomyelin phosphodiesterase [Bdellovibrio sp.]|nr:sphingomyelin phosphodiesterase [Bdellovibrio sp.]
MGKLKFCLLLLSLGLVWAQEGFAETSVYFENRTGSSITLQTSLSGTPLRRDAYQIRARMILPGQTLKIMQVNRDSGIKNGKSYKFTTNISVGEGQKSSSLNMNFYQILTGKFIGSRLQHGMIIDGRDKEWGTDHQGKFLGKVIGTTVVRLRVHDTGRGMHDNIYYTLETFAPPTANENLKAISYNVYMRPISLFKNGQYERAQLLPETLAGRDILVFQEAFDDDVRGVLKMGLAAKYPFQSTVVGTDRVFEQDGGVFIATRFPILEEDEYLFGSECARIFEDCLADKGVKYAKLWDGQRIIHVFATHLQNGDGRKDIAARKSQVERIHQFMLRKLSGSNNAELVLLMGDYNINLKTTPDAFSRYSLKTILSDDRPYSWDPEYNELASSGSAQQVDYIYYSENHLIPATFEQKVIPLKSKRRWKFLDSLHIFRDLSDHFPIEATMTF